MDVLETHAPGDAACLTRQALAAGSRNFIAVGGDGTVHEVLNGLFPEATEGARVSLGFLPLGTGNSFVRDFSHRGSEHAVQALLDGRRRPCDVLYVRSREQTMYSLNLVSLGFVAEVCARTRRRLKRYGAAGYMLALAASLAALRARRLPAWLNGDTPLPQPMTFLALCNSRYTGGRMRIAPDADCADGLLDVVAVKRVGRLRLLRDLPRIFTGGHVRLPDVTTARARRVYFELDAPWDVMIDGEMARIQPERVDVLAGALDVRL